MNEFYKFIPKQRLADAGSLFRWMKLSDGPAPLRNPFWYDKLWPPPDRRVVVGPMWWCFDQDPGNLVRGCGAPPGIRCRCGSALHGHDAGDEDTVAQKERPMTDLEIFERFLKKPNMSDTKYPVFNIKTPAEIAASRFTHDGPGIPIEILVREAEEAMTRVLQSKAAIQDAQREFDQVCAPLKAQLNAAEAEHKKYHLDWEQKISRLKGRL